ncbi:hypothetical protein BGZ72_006106 [Mortierella alpina]|nr:hypothetical protein BGZ72_006106 [Mortierella alpina]
MKWALTSARRKQFAHSILKPHAVAKRVNAGQHGGGASHEKQVTKLHPYITGLQSAAEAVVSTF